MTPSTGQRGQTSAGGGLIAAAGAPLLRAFHYVGGLSWMLVDTLVWTFRGLFSRRVRFGREALAIQTIRAHNTAPSLSRPEALHRSDSNKRSIVAFRFSHKEILT